MNAPIKDTFSYDVITYDLNRDYDGVYYVNDSYKSGTIELDPDKGTKYLIRELKRAGWLKRGIHHASIEIGGEYDYTLYINYKGYPAMELRNQAPPEFKY